MNISVLFRICLQFLAVCFMHSTAWAMDSYSSKSGQLDIEKVQVGTAFYYNVAVTVKRVVSVGAGPAAGSHDIYDAQNGTLSIPSVLVDNQIYYNVVVEVGGLVDAGIIGRSASTGQLLTSDSLQVCRLAPQDGRGDVAIGGFPRYVSRLRSTGTVNTAVIMVDFSDAPATMTPAQAYAKLDGASANFSEMSYGKFDYRMTPVLKWYRMSKPAGDYVAGGWSFSKHRAYIAEALALADPDFDFSAMDNFVILANPDAQSIGSSGPAFSANTRDGVVVDGRTLSNGATSAYDLNNRGAMWLNHEITHTLGLPDLYAFGGNFDKTSANYGYRFVGSFSYMGRVSSTVPHLTAWERWILGWVSDTQVNCMTESTATHSLTAVESIGGLKAVMVPLSSSRLLVVESRRALGMDKALPKAGALVYTVDATVQSGAGPLRVVAGNSQDADLLDATLASGQSVTVEGVTVRVDEAGSAGDTVTITRAK
jgi:M6 family metalloprotease-like protein